MMIETNNLYINVYVVYTCGRRFAMQKLLKYNEIRILVLDAANEFYFYHSSVIFR